MKRILIVLLALCLLAAGVQAGISLTFQDPEDFAARILAFEYNSGAGSSCPLGTSIPSWNQNAYGGNSYMITTDCVAYNVWYYSTESYFSNPIATPMTYSATTYLGSASIGKSAVQLYDVGNNLMWDYPYTTPTANDRLELIVIGGSAYLYSNGASIANAVVSQNPSWIAWGSHAPNTLGHFHGEIYYDDTIWGTAGTDSKYIFGMPEAGYFLMKDIINPAASGFYRANQTDPYGAPTLITSTTFTSTFGRGEGAGYATAEDVVLENYGAGVWQTVSTGTKQAGTINWNLTAFFASAAPYGLYDTTIRNQVPATPYVLSERIPYIGSGATVVFDRATYSSSDTAILTYLVTPTYWDPATYTYRIRIVDIYGAEKYTSAITSASGSVSATLTDTTYSDGVYYGLIERVQGSTVVLMNYATMTVVGYNVLGGYVMNAETGAVLSGASVNVTQGTTTAATLSLPSGAWNSTGNWLSGTAMAIVTTLAGYTTDSLSVTTLTARSVALNISLMPTVPTTTGVSVGGVVRDSAYSRPVIGATYHVKNGTEYTATTNIAGFARVDGLVSGTLYDVWSSKTGYANSTTAQKLVVGI